MERKIIPEEALAAAIVQGIHVHLDGRVPVDYKTNFFSTAQEEVVEIGLRLNTFTTYFTSQNSTVYVIGSQIYCEGALILRHFLLIRRAQKPGTISRQDPAAKSEAYGTDEVKTIIKNYRTL